MKHDTIASWAEPVPGAGPMNADDLLKLQDGAWRYELVEGVVVRMAPTGLEHFDVTRRLFRAMDRFAEERNLGIVTLPDTGFVLTRPGERDTVLSPDIAFVSAASAQRLPAPGTPERKKYLPLAPDLAVEVASPDQHHPEMAEKARRYLGAGVRLVWVVWPSAQQVDVWREGRDAPMATLDGAGMLGGLDVFPGFAFPVARLFG